MSVFTLTEQVAQARPGVIPCRSFDADLWFADEVAEIEQAQDLCRACPVQAACLAGAIDRKEPLGVWGGELFERGQVVAQRRPKGRPRKDADEIAARAQARLDARLAEVVTAFESDELAEALETADDAVAVA